VQRESARSASHELRIGDVFAGHRIEGVLGRGGMGVVYQATDLRLNRMAALKLITPTLSADEDFRRRFQRESQLAASVRQPNVVTIFQAGEADGLLYVTMELIRGMDLRALIDQRGRLDLGTASAIVTQTAAALDTAHAAGLVHRDVKPGNVLIAEDPPLHVYLTDFGLTKRTSSQSGITKAGLFVGTVDYAAPEQVKAWPVDARADVYALGCVLFEMVAGQPPFRRENEYATMYAHTSEAPPPLSSVVPGAPPALDAVLSRALAKDPGQRFPSAGDLARAVSAAVAGHAPSEPERTVAVGRAAPSPPPPTTPDSDPPPAQFPPQPGAHPVYGYGADPNQVPPPPQPPPSHPTSVLPPSRSPWIAVAAIVAVLLVAGGIAAALLLGGGGTDKPAADTSNPPSKPAAAPLADDVARLSSVLDLSGQGRTATTNGDFTAAIANRRQVIDQLDALTLAPELEQSRSLLREAMQASLRADQQFEACGGNCPEATGANDEATALKRDFVKEFNPFALKYLGRSFDPTTF
jgi:serine/threonine protein kinase